MMMMKILRFLVVGIVFWSSAFAGPVSSKNDRMLPSSIRINSDEMINAINAMNTTWKAGRNYPPNTPESYFKRLCGLKKSGKSILPRKVHSISKEFPLPAQFDSRTQWPDCAATIGLIRDQGDCGSCWAFATVEPISDRICIHSKGVVNVNISAEDLNDCVSGGCDGGFPDDAWDYYVSNGLVTGGLYGSNSGCLPYTLAGCSHHINGTLPPCPKDLAPTPDCKTQCISGYPKSYKADKHYGTSAYSVGGEEQIQQEILTHGPVTAGLEVFADFPTYKSGIYIRKSADSLGGHAVKILGWGVDQGVKYWLVANSWNSEWGESGYFRIRRGTNECGIEDEAFAGLPKL